MLTCFSRFLPSVRRFGANRRGDFAIMFGLMVPMLLIGTGMSISIVQITSAHSRLSNALDAALTSTARDITRGIIKEEDAEKTALVFLLANAGGGSMPQDSIRFASFAVDKAKQTIIATATGRAALAFPVFSLPGSQDVTAQSATLYSTNAVEVAMVLDVTGSMYGSKLNSLKTAAKNAVSSFMAMQSPGQDRVRLAVIPYATAVNTGSLSNVVFQERGPADAGTAPGLASPVGVSSAIDSCATERKGKDQLSDASPYSSRINRDYRLWYCPTAALMPLTSNKGALTARINSFTANGGTAGHIGVQWARYMLSPKWKDVLPASAAPGAYGDASVRKFAILMTDGEFNTAYACLPGESGDCSASYAKRLCADMRKDGIEIFTVGFQLTTAAARDVMQTCASTGGGKHYFETSSGSELDQAFQDIAKAIERLTVTR
ncbi:hypothetical protein CSC94_00150 [Zhengella mangrovi]|uniref:VWFA domain-containing protein n=1 Tax=Zhengella mangrovi TaxID=1982044 RepID=A0A2G1QSM0_9HYPH|nr:TadE/TadG family type IV pilus assembly protein [Zhengella mangrovi]PHP68460.1 hypothetical protein CSC94_00150 [Zhengella mangrovi]